MKCLHYLSFIIILLTLTGCSSTNEPQPYKYSKKKLIYNPSLMLYVDKNKTTIYIDNRFDEERKKRVIKGIYNKLLNNVQRYDTNLQKPLNYYDKELFGQIDIALKTKYDQNFCFIGICDEKFLPTKENMKIISDGILIKGIDNINGVRMIYSHNAHYLRGYYGLGTLLKLDIQAMEKGIAHFTDEYLNKFSLKEPLKTELKKLGYNIVENIMEADVIFSVENLLYSELKYLFSQVPFPKNYTQTFDDLVQVKSMDKYFRLPISIIHEDNYDTKFFQQKAIQKFIKANQKSNGAGMNKVSLAFGILEALQRAKESPISTLNSIKVFSNKKELGRIIELTAAKDNPDKKVLLNLHSRTKNKYNEILSDELIDDLNKQAAKQVLSKIRFIEK